MEKYYLVIKDGVPYCSHYSYSRLPGAGFCGILFWGEDTREEESYDLSRELRLRDVFPTLHGGKVRVVGTIM